MDRRGPTPSLRFFAKLNFAREAAASLPLVVEYFRTLSRARSHGSDEKSDRNGTPSKVATFATVRCPPQLPGANAVEATRDSRETDRPGSNSLCLFHLLLFPLGCTPISTSAAEAVVSRRWSTVFSFGLVGPWCELENWVRQWKVSASINYPWKVGRNRAVANFLKHAVLWIANSRSDRQYCQTFLRVTLC